MSMINLAKLDKFYFILAGILALSAVLVIFTINSIFSAISLAYGYESLNTGAELKVDKERLDSVYSKVFEE